MFKRESGSSSGGGGGSKKSGGGGGGLRSVPRPSDGIYNLSLGSGVIPAVESTTRNERGDFIIGDAEIKGAKLMEGLGAGRKYHLGGVGAPTTSGVAARSGGVGGTSSSSGGGSSSK